MKDARVERACNDAGVKWWYEQNFHMEKVNYELSKENKARLIPIIPDHLERIRRTVRKKIDIFAILLWKIPGKDEYVVVRGLHRFTAFREEGYKVLPDVYICETDDKSVVRRLTVGGNLDEGHAIEKPEQLSHAYDAVVKFGATRAAAAAEFFLEERELGEYFLFRAASERIAGFNVDGTENIADTIIKRLHSLQSNVVAKAATQLVVEAELTSSHIEDLVPLLNKARSEHDQMVLLDSWRERADIKIRITRRHARRKAASGQPTGKPLEVHSSVLSPTHEKFRRYLRHLLNIMLKNPTMELLGLDVSDAILEDVRKEWSKLEELAIATHIKKKPVRQK